MYSIIVGEAAIADAQTRLEGIVRSAASKGGPLKVGYQGGGREVEAFYLSRLNFWVSFADSGNRYWNALGLGNPFQESHPIVTEINPVKKGIDRRIAGAFIEDRAGQIHLAHRGRVGGGRKGIGKRAFMDWYPGIKAEIHDGDYFSQVIIVARLDDAGLLDALAEFTRRVAKFKIRTSAG